MNPQQLHTLPEGWEMAKLRVAIAELESGVSLNSLDKTIGPGEVGVLKVSAVSGCIFKPTEHKTIVSMESHLARINPRKGSIIISRSNTPELVGHSAYIHQDYPDLYLPDKLWQTVLRKGAEVDSVWLSQVLASDEMLQRISNKASGSSNSMKNISKDTFLNFEIWFPPLPEQRRIAAVLGTWDRAIEQTTNLLKQLRTRHRGLMQRLLTGKRRLPGFDGEWLLVKLGDVFKERSQIGYYNLPLLSITAELGVINRDELVKRDTSNEDKSKYKRICPGDIGYNTMRMWQGRSAVSALEGIVSPAYTIVTPKSNANVQYMGHLFKFPDMIHRFYRNSQGLVDDTLNCKFPEFAKVRVSIPPTVEEQRAIAQILDASLREIRQQEAKLDALREQKRGLMQCLLTGQVRVP